MTPINQGLYEFKKESLIELRKTMGVSQSKMAELLGVPANTLSRWETGATVPDASSLAAIYSLEWILRPFLVCAVVL
jgi:transcriptional regulator with XRE-family HTH domain